MGGLSLSSLVNQICTRENIVSRRDKLRRAEQVLILLRQLWNVPEPAPLEPYWTTPSQQRFANRGLLLQQRYSSSTDGFLLDARTMEGFRAADPPAGHVRKVQLVNTWKWMRDLPAVSGNSKVSTSSNLEHAAKYGVGFKYYGQTKPRSPDYENGSPRLPVIGLLCVFAFDDDDEYLACNPIDVVQLHNERQLDINPRIVTEQEVSFDGFIPPEMLKYVILISVPDFASGDLCDHWGADAARFVRRAVNPSDRFIHDVRNF